MQELTKEIIARASGGDREAFEHIYRASSGFVYNVAYRVVNSREAAEDVTQEVFVKIYRNLKKFSFRSSLKTWIYRITVNCAINDYQKRKKLINSTVSFDDRINCPVSSCQTEQAIQRQDSRQLVEKLLVKLNLQQKTCIVLREIQGLNYQEIAETLKININTVRSRLRRARRVLLAQGRSEVIKNEL